MDLPYVIPASVTDWNSVSTGPVLHIPVLHMQNVKILITSHVETKKEGEPQQFWNSTAQEREHQRKGQRDKSEYQRVNKISNSQVVLPDMVTVGQQFYMTRSLVKHNNSCISLEFEVVFPESFLTFGKLLKVRESR